MPDLAELAGQIAHFLGSPWIRSDAKVSDPGAYESSRFQYIQGPDDDRIEIRLVTGSQHPRLQISCQYPLTARGERIPLPYQVTSPSITVDISRGAYTIAREINRRLLPAYRSVLATILQRKYAADAFESTQRSNLDALAAIFGVELSPDNIKSGSFPFSSIADGRGYGQLEVFDKTVNIRLNSVTLPKATEIAKLWSGNL